MNYIARQIDSFDRYNEEYNTLASCTERARAHAWSSGEKYGVYKLIATADPSELVNTVKVTEEK